MKKRIKIILLIFIVLLVVMTAIIVIDNKELIHITQEKRAEVEDDMKEKIVSAIESLKTEKGSNVTLDDLTQEWLDSKITDYKCTLIDDASISGKKIIIEENNIVYKVLIDESLNITEIEKDGSSIDLEYESLSKDGENIKILITVRDRENGLNQIEMTDGNIIYCYGKNKVAIDYTVEMGKEYKIKITSENGEESEKTILINDYYYRIIKNLETGIDIDNKSIKTAYNESYKAQLKVQDGYMIDKIYVTMNGVQVPVNRTSKLINIENVIGDIQITVTAMPVITAYGETDSTGKTTLNLEKYVDSASNGSIIYIPEGTYYLNQFALDAYAQVGIADKGKAITFIGENENTILIYKGKESKKRDGCLIQANNSATVIRNMVLEFYPGKENNYSNAIFRWTARKNSQCIYTCQRDYSRVI